MFIDELTSESEELRKKFNSLRGSTVSAFAHAEFFMKAYLLALSQDEQFDDGGGYSHLIENVIRNFRLSFENNDFHKTTCEDVSSLMSAFEKAIDDRNQFVHGLARLIAKERQVEMRRYLPAKEGETNIIIKTYDLDKMENSVSAFDEICRSVILLIMNLDNTFGLGLKEPVDSNN